MYLNYTYYIIVLKDAYGYDAHGEVGPEYWTTLNPCAEPMCEAAENLSHVSSGVLVTVKSMIYSNERYSVFGNMCKQADGDNGQCVGSM